MFPAADPFSGAIFHGGQFNITINTVNKSQALVQMVQFLQNEAMNESKELNRRMMMTALHFNEKFNLLRAFLKILMK